MCLRDRICACMCVCVNVCVCVCARGDGVGGGGGISKYICFSFFLLTHLDE